MLWINKLYNLEEMQRFQERHKLTKPAQEETEYLSRPQANNKIGSIIIKLPTKVS